MLPSDILLVTDFFDFYDLQFGNSLSKTKFFRKAKSDMTRREQFELLSKIRHTPEFGSVREIAEKWNKEDHSDPDKDLYVVVYTDELAHCGEGKDLLLISDAVETYPDNLASVYVIDSCSKSRSLRHLVIGDRGFDLLYESDDDWRSNCGNVEVSIKKDYGVIDFDERLPYPLYAIDYVSTCGLDLYAVDFNTAPGLGWTGIENLMEPKEIAEAISRAIDFFGPRCRNIEHDLMGNENE